MAELRRLRARAFASGINAGLSIEEAAERRASVTAEHARPSSEGFIERGVQWMRDRIDEGGGGRADQAAGQIQGFVGSHAEIDSAFAFRAEHGGAAAKRKVAERRGHVENRSGAAPAAREHQMMDEVFTALRSDCSDKEVYSQLSLGPATAIRNASLAKRKESWKSALSCMGSWIRIACGGQRARFTFDQERYSIQQRRCTAYLHRDPANLERRMAPGRHQIFWPPLRTQRATGGLFTLDPPPDRPKLHLGGARHPFPGELTLHLAIPLPHSHVSAHCGGAGNQILLSLVSPGPRGPGHS